MGKCLTQFTRCSSLEIPVVTRTNTHGALRRRDYSMFIDNGTATDTRDTPSTATSTRSNYRMFESIIDNTRNR